MLWVSWACPNLGIGFGTLEQVEGYGIVTQVALGFIAFVIGNEFRLGALKSMGRQAIAVGVLQAVVTTALVDVALVALHLARPDVILAVRCADSGRDRCGYGARCHPDGGQAV